MRLLFWTDSPSGTRDGDGDQLSTAAERCSDVGVSSVKEGTSNGIGRDPRRDHQRPAVDRPLSSRQSPTTSSSRTIVSASQPSNSPPLTSWHARRIEASYATLTTSLMPRPAVVSMDTQREPRQPCFEYIVSVSACFCRYPPGTAPQPRRTLWRY